MYFTSTTVKSVGHSMVVYHLHGQTGRFTVRANVKQKFKTGITCSLLPNHGGYQTGIKDDLEEIKHEFLIRTFCPEKLDYILRCSVAPRNFR